MSTDLQDYARLLTGIPEIDIEITNKLDDHTLLRFCRVNIYARSLCQDDFLWRERIASRYNNIIEKPDNLSWREFYFIIPYLPLSENNVKRAVDKNNINVLNIIIRDYGEEREIITSLMKRALETGNIPILNWLKRKGITIDELVENYYFDIDFNELIRKAIVKGDIAFLEWLYQEEIGLNPNDQEAMMIAINSEQLPSVKWLYQKGYSIPANLLDRQRKEFPRKIREWLLSQERIL